MTIRSKLRVVFLLFGFLPLSVMAAVASQSGLGTSREFYNTIAAALTATCLAGLLEPGVIGRWLFSKQISQMQAFCRAVKEGQYDSSLAVPNEMGSGQGENELVSLMRDMNWMMHRIKTNSAELQKAIARLTLSKKEIQLQKVALEEVNEAQQAMQRQLQEKTDALTDAVSKIRGLLDNAGQGFLSIGEDLKVEGEYSAECVLIFSQEIEQQWLPGLLYPQDQGQQAFLEALFKKLFSEVDAYQQEAYFSLLPEEIMVDESLIRLSYKWLPRLDEANRQEMLVILTDVSAQKNMEKKMQAERDVLSMVVKAATHRQEFHKLMSEYEVFCTRELQTALTAPEAACKKINAIFRSIHTWKGAFGQMGMLRMMAKLHDMEEDLARLRECGDAVTEEELRACFTRYTSDCMLSWLQEEAGQLQAILGTEFFREEELIIIENEKLLNLEDKIKRKLSPCKAKELVCELRKLRHRSLAEMLSVYPEYLRELAMRQGKELTEMSIEGDVFIDPERHRPFIKSLVHVFRNAVAHGLETPEERLLQEKPLGGRIYCQIEEQNNRALLRIGDDGRGMDTTLLKKRAVAQRLCTQSEAELLSEEEALLLIFADGFSSAELPDALSGRGVGLSAVKKEVESLDGRIQVLTQSGGGSEFLFSFPLQTEDIQELSLTSPWSERVVEKAAQLLKEEYQLEVKQRIRKGQIAEGDLPLREISAFMEMTGAFSGRVVFSADAKAAMYLAETASRRAAYEEAESSWTDSVLGEFLNHAVGGAVREWRELEEELELGAPAVIRAQNAAVRYLDADIFSWELHTEAGMVQLHMVFFRGKEGEADGACAGCR